MHSLRFSPLFALLALAVPAHATVEPVLTEVQTSNQFSLYDEDGEAVDWVEIANPSGAPLSLAGYSLAEMGGPPWAFPAVTIPPWGQIVVFASGKNRAVVVPPWHTDFSLRAGETVELRNAASVAVSMLGPIPEALAGVSYGLSDERTATVLVAENAAQLWSVEFSPNTLSSPPFTARTYNTKGWNAGNNGLLWSRKASGFWLEVLGVKVTPADGRELEWHLAQPHGTHFLNGWMVPALNFASGPTATLKFPADQAWPQALGITAVAPVIYHAMGSVTASAAGTWTLGVQNADAESTGAYVVKVAGQTFSSTGGGGIIIDFPPPRPLPGAIIVDPVPVGTVPNLHVVTLPVAGAYPIEAWWVQGKGETAGFELSVAAGEYTEFNSQFQLIGGTRVPVQTQRILTASAPVGARADAATYDAAKALLTRTFFNAPANPAAQLQLRIRAADGFRAWIDGQLVAERNATGQTATVARGDLEIGQVERITLALRGADLTGTTTNHCLTVQALMAPGQRSLAYVQGALVALEPTSAAPVLGYFSPPSPGTPNVLALGPPAAEPIVSVPRGMYADPVSLTLGAPAAGALIYYSVDGRAPAIEAGNIYHRPLLLSRTTVLQAVAVVPGHLPSHVILHTYLLPNTQATQSGAALPTAWGPATADYEFDADAVTTAGAALPISLKALPSLSIVTDAEQLFGPTGLHAHPDLKGSITAIDASVECIYPQSHQQWREPASLRIKGEASRTTEFLKHGFRLDFGSGAGDLRRPLLGDSERKRYNTLNLHGSYVDNLFTLGQQAQYTRDLWVRDTLRLMGQAAPHGDYYQVYLNGLYWGLYHAGERPDQQWCSFYLGGKTSDWDIIDSDGLKEGSNDGYADLLAAASTAEPGTPEAYATVSAKLDLVSLCDYMLVNFYAVNTDWPGHNWYAVRDRRSGVWRFITWDAEYSFDRPNANIIPDPAAGYFGGDPAQFFGFLSQYPEFLKVLAQRILLHTSTGGALSPAVAERTWMRRANVVEPAILAECARWGDHGLSETHIILADWKAEQARLRRVWFPARTKLLIRQLRAFGYYPEVFAPSITPGSSFRTGPTVVTIANTGSNAQLFYTKDGSEPQGPDGQPAATALPYAAPFTVTPPAVIKAGGWYDGDASPVLVANYQLGVDPHGLHFTEVNYNPLNPLEEFVEITNDAAVAIPLSGVSLRGAVNFTFPAGARILPGQLQVIARNAAGFLAKYPTISLAGIYTGVLADEGENLLLWHATAGKLDEIAFRPYEPWAFGTGSLYRLDNANPAPSAWAMNVPTPGRFANGRAGVELPFSITLGKASAGQLPLSFPIAPGHHYVLQTATSLAGPWQTVRTVPAPTAAITRSEMVPANAPARAFYRVQRVPD